MSSPTTRFIRFAQLDQLSCGNLSPDSLCRVGKSWRTLVCPQFGLEVCSTVSSFGLTKVSLFIEVPENHSKLAKFSIWKRRSNQQNKPKTGSEGKPAHVFRTKSQKQPKRWMTVLTTVLPGGHCMSPRCFSLWSLLFLTFSFILPVLPCPFPVARVPPVSLRPVISNF